MRSLTKLHTLLDRFVGPLPPLDIKVIVKLGDRWIFGLVGIGLIYLPLFWLMHPMENAR